MNTYCCHCTVQMQDKGLKAATTVRRTLLVTASSEEEATKEVQEQCRKEYSGNLNVIDRVDVELTKSI